MQSSPGQQRAISASDSAAQMIPQLEVERIIGMSQCGCNNSSHVIDGWVSSAGAITINPKNGDIAYIAGAFIVIYGVKTSIQEKFLKNEKNRPYQCLVYSPKGTYLAAGDCSTKAPEITVWQVNEIESNGRGYTAMYHLTGHRFGIQNIKFSPMEDYLISLGDSTDRGLFVWDFKNQQYVTSNKLGRLVNAFEFEQNQKYFVTAGYTHLKFWYFDKDTNKVKRQQIEGSKDSYMMESFSADIAKVKNKIFVGVACKHSCVYSLTNDGCLYIFSEDRKLNKWMNIKVNRAFGVSISQSTNQLFCACAEGVVRVFNPETLAHVITLQKPPPLGQTNIESGVKRIKVSQHQVSKFSDALAVISDDKRHRLIVVYSDKMVFLWDVKDQAKIQVSRTFLSHNGPIHDIQKIEQSQMIGMTDTEEGKLLSLDQGLTRFVTCSSDRTVRFWHFADQFSLAQQNKSKLQKGLFRNAYCKDMSKIIFVKNQDQVSANDFEVFRARPHDRDQEGKTVKSENKDENELDPMEQRKNQDIEQAIRCLRISPDGSMLACGDWEGNIRIHDLTNDKLEEKQCIEAHENEILSLDFAQTEHSKSGSILIPDQGKEHGTTNSILVSGSRDQLVQLYDCSNSFEPVQIIESHVNSVTAVRFTNEKDQPVESVTPGGPRTQNQLSLITTGADMKLFKHSLIQDKKLNDFEPFEQKGIESFENKIFSLDVSTQSSLILTGHKQTLTLSCMKTLKKIWEKRSDPNRKVIPDHLKVMLDESGKVAVTSTTDKQLMLFDTENSRILAKAQCGEIITGMCFTDNKRHIITTSSQGVIYIFKLPESVIKLLTLDLVQQAKQQAIQKKHTVLHQIAEDEFEDSVKRVSGVEQIREREKSTQSSKLGSSKQSNPIQSELDDVMAQIGQVSNNLEKMDVYRKEKQQQDDQPTQSASQEAVASAQTQLQQQKTANDSKPPRKEICPISPYPGEQNGIGRGSEIVPLNLNNNNNSLPRWAQSIAGSGEVSVFLDDSSQKENQFNANDHKELMESIFEENLRRHSKKSSVIGSIVEEEKVNNDQLQKEKESEKYKIDLLDGNDEEQEDLNINDKDDDDLKEVKQSVKEKQFQNLFGIEGEESLLSSNLRKSKDWFSKKSKNAIRSSIASKFFMQRETESQRSVFNSNGVRLGSGNLSEANSRAAALSEQFSSVGNSNRESEVKQDIQKKESDCNVLESSNSDQQANFVKNMDQNPTKSEEFKRSFTEPMMQENKENESYQVQKKSETNLAPQTDMMNKNLSAESKAVGEIQPQGTNLIQPQPYQIVNKPSEVPAQIQSKPEENKMPSEQINNLNSNQMGQSVDVQILMKTKPSQDQVSIPEIKNTVVQSQIIQPPPTNDISHRFSSVPNQLDEKAVSYPQKDQNDVREMSMDFSSKSLQPSLLNQSVQSSNVNFQLQFEFQRLNETLKNINQLMNLGQTQDVAASIANDSDSKPYNQFSKTGSNQSISVPNAPSGSQAQQWMDPSVSDKLSQSIGLFNTVMNQVQKQDNFDQIQKQGLMYSQVFSKGAFANQSQVLYPNPNDSMALQSVYPSSNQSPNHSQMQMSQIMSQQMPPPADELLDKYSDILLEKLMKKMEQKK